MRVEVCQHFSPTIEITFSLIIFIAFQMLIQPVLEKSNFFFICWWILSKFYQRLLHQIYIGYWSVVLGFAFFLSPCTTLKKNSWNVFSYFLIL